MKELIFGVLEKRSTLTRESSTISVKRKDSISCSHITCYFHLAAREKHFSHKLYMTWSQQCIKYCKNFLCSFCADENITRLKTNPNRTRTYFGGFCLTTPLIMILKPDFYANIKNLICWPWDGNIDWNNVEIIAV